MKQEKINSAYIALEKLSDNDELNEMEQWKIYNVRKALRPHVEFYDERRNQIKDKYMELSDNGQLSGKPAQDYMADVQRLDELDVEIKEIDVPKIRLVRGIKCTTIEAVEGFVEFAPPEENV